MTPAEIRRSVHRIHCAVPESIGDTDGTRERLSFAVTSSEMEALAEDLQKERELLGASDGPAIVTVNQLSGVRLVVVDGL